jgi:hypothetical protein
MSSELLAVFGFWWWGLLLIASGAIIFGLQKSWLWMTSAVFVATFTAMLVFGDLKAVCGWLAEHYVLAVVCVVLYLGISLLWGVFKWFTFCRDRLQEYDEKKREWLGNRGFAESGIVPDKLQEEWNQWITSFDHFSKETMVKETVASPHNDVFKMRTVRVFRKHPVVWENKNRVSNWMMFWPWSAAWYIVYDLMGKLWDKIVWSMSGFLDNISKKVWVDVDKDFTTIKKDNK